jgi:hypothetical protein
MNNNRLTITVLCLSSIFSLIGSQGLLSQENSQEKQSKLFELIICLQQNNLELLKVDSRNDIDQTKAQIDHAINNLSLLLGIDDSMVKMIKSDTEAVYHAAVKMTPEITEKNANILSDFGLYKFTAREQLQSIYPDADIMLMLWKYYHQPLYAMMPAEVDFLNAVFMSEMIHVFRILDMHDEYAEYLKNWRLTRASVLGELDVYSHQIILAREVNNELSGDFILEQVVPKLQLLISEQGKYEQFEFYRNSRAILQCRLALAYLAKGEAEKGAVIIEDIRKEFDNFDPRIMNTPEHMAVYYLFCKFYVETAILLQDYQSALEWLDDSQLGLPLTREPQAIGHEYYYRKRADILKHLGREDEAKEAQAEAEKIADNLEKCRIVIREAMQSLK